MDGASEGAQGGIEGPMKLHDRLKRLESRRQSEIVEIVVRGGLPDDPDRPCHAQAAGHIWHRTEGEELVGFQERVRAEALALGAKHIVWGGLPEQVNE